MFLRLKPRKGEKVKISEIKLTSEEKKDRIRQHSQVSNDAQNITVQFKNLKMEFLVNIIKRRVQNDFFRVGKITRRKASYA